MTVNTRVIKLFLRRQDLPYVPLRDGLRLQILPTINYLPSCQKHHFAAFIADAAILVVWDDEPKHLLIRAKSIEEQLMRMIWKADPMLNDEKTEKSHVVDVAEIRSDASSGDLEREESTAKPRKLVMNQAVLCGLTLILLIAAIGAGWRQIVIELIVDKQMLRLAFVAVVPFQCWLALVNQRFSIIGLSNQLTQISSSSCSRSSEL